MKESLKPLKIERQIYYDKHGAMCGRKVIVLPDGRRVLPAKRLGFVWAMRVWADGVSRYSRGDLVFEWVGEPYRMRSRSAVPLNLAAGEKLESIGFGDNGSFLPLEAKS